MLRRSCRYLGGVCYCTVLYCTVGGVCYRSAVCLLFSSAAHWSLGGAAGYRGNLSVNIYTEYYRGHPHYLLMNTPEIQSPGITW